MNILAVDTTEEALSLAVLAGGRVLSVDRRVGAPHDEALFGAVDRLLGKAGLALEDLSALAAASGPGRFTGIRIGMTFAAVASERLGIPALAVSRLEALAFKTPGRLVAAVIPGWKDEKFYQVFERKGRLKPKAPPAWTTAEGWVQARASVSATGAAVVEACPGARDILGLAVDLLGRAKRPRFEPLYLKLAGYERRLGGAALALLLFISGHGRRAEAACSFDKASYSERCLKLPNEDPISKDVAARVKECVREIVSVSDDCDSEIAEVEASGGGGSADERRAAVQRLKAGMGTLETLMAAGNDLRMRHRAEAGRPDSQMDIQTVSLMNTVEVICEDVRKKGEGLLADIEKKPLAKEAPSTATQESGKGTAVSLAGRISGGLADGALVVAGGAPVVGEPDPGAIERLKGKEERLEDRKGAPDELADSWRTLARQYGRAGDPSAAGRAVDRSIRLDPSAPAAFVLRADLRRAQGDLEGALADAGQALRLDPDNAGARGLGRMLRSSLPGGLGDKVRSQRVQFDSGSGGERGTLPAAEGGGASGPAGGGAELPASTAQKAAAAARRRMAVGDHTGALVELTRAIQADRKNPAWWRLRAEASNKAGNFAAALADAREALLLKPDDPGALLERAYALLRQGDAAAALADARRAAQLEPGNALARLYAAMALERMGRLEEAAAEYAAAARLDLALAPVVEEARRRLGGGAPEARRGSASPAVGGRLPRLGLILAAALLLLYPLVRKAGGWTTGPGGGLPAHDAADAGSPATAASAASPATLRQGTLIGGNIRIVRELARGGMGVVFEAFDTTLQRAVAVKQLRRELCPGREELDRFMEEARLVAQLRHPHLAQIHSAVEQDGDLFLVFDLVRGRPLDAVLRDAGPLEPGRAACVVAELCDALGHAHGLNVIHRDLKPGNVMVEEDGRCRIMDFGIAHRARSADRQTWTAAWGTPPYMAPEQELGRVSKESDLFALGVMAYEMLTGVPPFAGPDYLAQKMEKRWRPATGRRPSLAAAFDPFFAKALDPEPSFRYRSAGEFSAAFSAAAKA